MAELDDSFDTPSPASPADDQHQERSPQASDKLFAAAMPKEEIGALAFLKVVGAGQAKKCPPVLAQCPAGVCRTTRTVMVEE